MLVNVKEIDYQHNEDHYLVTFDMCWENAWKNEINCDGVYIFIKYKNKNKYGYHSAKMLSSSKGEFDYTDKAPAGFEITNSPITTGIYVPNTRLGSFLYPVEDCMERTMFLSGVKTPVEMSGEIEDVQVFAIEMVYIPTGAFELGETIDVEKKALPSPNSFYTYGKGGIYKVESEEPIAFGKEPGNLTCRIDTPMGLQGEDTFVIPAEYPKGYCFMWYMKYPLTEGQFVQFVNCLTRKQQIPHVMADITTDKIEHFYAMTDTEEEIERCAVYCRKDGNGTEAPIKFFTYAKEREMNIISFDDVIAFACFAGLRPISELEFEKAARGTAAAVPNEFAWGTSRIGRVFHFDGVDGSGSEKLIPVLEGDLCNCNFGANSAKLANQTYKSETGSGWGGPISAGCFENSPIIAGYSKRECTGASYYGVMELTGNLWEFLITVGNSAGRSFIPKHGTGELNEEGHSVISGWPSYKTGEGGGVRGGAFLSPAPARIFLSARSFASHPKADKRYHGGIRAGF